MIPTPESVDEILWCDYSNETSSADEAEFSKSKYSATGAAKLTVTHRKCGLRILVDKY